MGIKDVFTPAEMARVDQGHAMWLDILRGLAIGVRASLADGMSTAETSYIYAFSISRSEFRHHHLAALLATSLVESIVNDQEGRTS